MKSKRQKKIIELIERYSIDTQEELISRLADAGFVATQATISRDIRELKLIKTMTAGGIYEYVQPARNETLAPKFNSALADSITHVDTAGNMLVIKTYPGMAQPVASLIDGMGDEDLLGCVGGDDTVLAVIRNAEHAGVVCEKIRRMLQSL